MFFYFVRLFLNWIQLQVQNSQGCFDFYPLDAWNSLRIYQVLYYKSGKLVQSWLNCDWRTPEEGLVDSETGSWNPPRRQTQIGPPDRHLCFGKAQLQNLDRSRQTQNWPLDRHLCFDKLNYRIRAILGRHRVGPQAHTCASASSTTDVRPLQADTSWTLQTDTLCSGEHSHRFGTSLGRHELDPPNRQLC